MGKSDAVPSDWEARLNPRRLAEYVWSFRRTVLGLVLCVGLVVLAMRLVATGTYQASVQILLLSPVAETESQPRYELTLDSYLELARGDSLFQRTWKACSSRLGEAALRPGAVRLDAYPIRNTRVLILTALAPEAQDAAEFATEAGRQFLQLLREVRSQEVLDKTRLISLELETLDAVMKEQKAALDALLVTTGQWTEEELRSEISRLRQQRSQRLVELTAAEVALDARLSQLSVQLASLEGRLAKDRESLAAITLGSWKLQQLRSAAGTLLHRSQTLGTEVNERLGHAVSSGEAQAPRKAADASALNFGVLGAGLALMLTVALLVGWALLTGQHLQPGDVAPRP